MKTLIPPRGLKGIDQAASADATYRYSYPIDSYQGWLNYGVSPELALNVITIYQCVRILAETFASLPLIVYRRLEEGGKERATDHPLYKSLHDQPNPTMTSFVWRELLMSHVATWGNAYNEIRVNGMGELELWPIRPDRIAVRWADGGRTREYFYLSPTGTETKLRDGSVFHVQGLSSDGLVGLTPISVMRRAISLYRKAEQYGEAVFDNGARPAIVMKHPGKLSTGAVDRLGSQMDALRGSGNAGKTVILEEGLDVHEIGFPPEDAQFMETRIFQKRELAAAFRIPAGMVGDPERGEEKEDEEARKFIKGGMVPHFVRFEQEVRRQLIEEDDDVFAEFLADGYLRGDPKARADAYAVEWEHGNLSNDEWRARENLNPLPDGLGKIYYRPANWIRVDETEPQPVGGDASRDTQFGQGAELVDQLTRAKGLLPGLADPLWGQFDCPDCGRMIARKAAPGTVGHCKSCRAEKVYGEVAA